MKRSGISLRDWIWLVPVALVATGCSPPTPPQPKSKGVDAPRVEPEPVKKDKKGAAPPSPSDLHKGIKD